MKELKELRFNESNIQKDNLVRGSICPKGAELNRTITVQAIQ